MTDFYFDFQRDVTKYPMSISTARTTRGWAKTKALVWRIADDIIARAPRTNDTLAPIFNYICGFIHDNELALEYNQNGFTYNTDGAYLFDDIVRVAVADYLSYEVHDWTEAL